jgi:type I restriction enzyme M protein
MELTNLKEPQDVPVSILVNEKVIPYLYNLSYEYLKSDVHIATGNIKARADLVAYLDEEKIKPYIVVEVKSNLPNELTLLDPAVQQVFTVAAAMESSVRYLLVTNGSRYYWFERISEGHSLIQLDGSPKHLQQIYQMSLFKEKLLPITDPEQFLRIMNSVIQAIAREGVVFGLRMATEINRILLAKLKDEEILSAGGQSIFTTNNLMAEQVAQNIEYLYKAAIASLEDISIDKIPTKEGLWFLSPQALSTVVRILEQYALSTVTASIRGGFFWEAFSDYGRIEGGIHTTPVGLAELLVQLIQPEPGMRIIDPACGSGLFLIGATKYIENSQILAQTQLTHLLEEPHHLNRDIVGMEWNAEVAELASTNLALNGISPNKIIHANALDLWALKFYGINTQSYDRVILDPPVGDALDDEQMLQQYEVYRQTKKLTKEMLFIELAIKLLRPGGLLAVLVPDSLLSSPAYVHTRTWLLEKTVPRAIISLPTGAFAPVGHSGKATLLLLEKDASRDKVNEPVLIADVKSIGYDKSGKAIDPSDLPDLLATAKTFFQTGKADIYQANDKLQIWTVAVRELDSKRLDVAQLNPRSYNLLNQNHYRIVQLKDLVEIISGHNIGEKAYVEKGQGTALILQAGAIRDLTLNFSNAPYISSKDYEQVKRVQVRSGDVLVTTTGQYLGRATAVEQLPKPAIASSAVTILRPRHGESIDPFFLAAVISSDIGKTQIEQKKAASIAQSFIRRADLGTIQIPVPNPTKQKEMATRLRNMITTVEKLHQLAQQLEVATKKLVFSELMTGEDNA